MTRNPGATKRRKERERQDRQREKLAKRALRKIEKKEKEKLGPEEGVDPDIAHILPGPQPPQED